MNRIFCIVICLFISLVSLLKADDASFFGLEGMQYDNEKFNNLYLNAQMKFFNEASQSDSLFFCEMRGSIGLDGSFDNPDIHICFLDLHFRHLYIEDTLSKTMRRENDFKINTLFYVPDIKFIDLSYNNRMKFDNNFWSFGFGIGGNWGTDISSIIFELVPSVGIHHLMPSIEYYNVEPWRFDSNLGLKFSLEPALLLRIGSLSLDNRMSISTQRGLGRPFEIIELGSKLQYSIFGSDKDRFFSLVDIYLNYNRHIVYYGNHHYPSYSFGIGACVNLFWGRGLE